MELILVKRVQNLGEEGDVVKVADGYARNYLLPQKLAVQYTQGNMKSVEELIQRREARIRQEEMDMETLAQKLQDVSCTIQVKVGEDDKLYGSVTSQDIAEAIAGEGFEIDKKKIQLEEPIRKIGVYTVDIHLHPEVTAQVKVWVVKE